jgi:hypothetical protein
MLQIFLERITTSVVKAFLAMLKSDVASGQLPPDVFTGNYYLHVYPSLI